MMTEPESSPVHVDDSEKLRNAHIINKSQMGTTKRLCRFLAIHYAFLEDSAALPLR